MSITANPLSTAISLDEFTTNVEIFTSTKAKDIPSKINAVAVDLKANVNGNSTHLLNYVNTTLVPHINSEMAVIVNDYNTLKTDLTTQQNNYETTITNQQNTFETNITSQQNTFETNITSQQNTFETEMTTNIGGYIDAQGVGYSVNQFNDNFGFTRPIATADYTFDANGKITGIVEGIKETTNITYDVYGKITGYTETITVDGVPYTKTFTISKDVSGNIEITEV